MTRSIPKLSPHVLEEASDWLIEFSEGTVDASGRAQFDTWLRRSPEHVQAYLQVAALWEEVPVLGEHRVLPSDDLVARVLAEGNIVSLDARGPENTQPSPPPAREDGRRRPKLRLHAVAASLLAFIAAGAWIFNQRDTYSTATGEERSVRLEDGSTVELNSQSKLRVRFGVHERRVELLRGQAFFRVAKDAARPFIVSTDTTQVRAVGTEFDVYRKTDGTVVTVLEGRVAVLSELTPSTTPATGSPVAAPSSTTRPESSVGRGYLTETSKGAAPQTAQPLSAGLMKQPGEVLLSAGEQLVIAPQATLEPEPTDVTLAIAWTQKKIAFQGALLREVVEEFNRYNTRRLVVVDPVLMNTRISGVFSSSDPASLLRFLRELPGIRIEETNSEIRILSK
jgi:transmembrane sensor